MRHPITGPVVRGEDERPHSRACDVTPHSHGPGCHSNCPTCHGWPDPAADGEHVHVCATCAQVWNGERWVQA